MGEDKVKSALRSLAKEMEQQQAPPQLEATLRLAFRQEHGRPVFRRKWFPAAVAAAVLVAAGLTWVISRQQAPVVVRTQPHQPAPAAAASAPELPVAEVVQPVAVQKPRPRRKPVTVQAVKTRPAPASAPPLREIATEFLPFGSAGPLPAADTGRIVRVRVPRSTMSGFGFPVNPDRMLETVKADVVLGDGGMVRAIRFVQ
jgi:hypothetical protein